MSLQELEMDVLIVAKTHMSNAACVGGVLENGRYVRILDANGNNQSSYTKLNVGDLYHITFRERVEKKLPHIEDILVLNMTFKFSLSINEMVKSLLDRQNIKIWNGSTDNLFDGKLQWTHSGSGYISESNGIPNNSVGFWIPDSDLIRRDYNEKIRYSYTPIKWRSIPFVGFHSPVDKILAGSLLRVSLARWWSPNEEEEKKCYLQLSGWY